VQKRRFGCGKDHIRWRKRNSTSRATRFSEKPGAIKKIHQRVEKPRGDKHKNCGGYSQALEHEKKELSRRTGGELNPSSPRVKIELRATTCVTKGLSRGDGE